MFELLTDVAGGWLFYLSAGIGIAFSILILLFLIGNSRDWTLVHGIVIGMVGCAIALVLNGFTNLFEWILLGLYFVDLGATVFLVGLVSMIAVMLWNCIATSGRTLVR